MITMSDERKENIQKLETLAEEVLRLKKQYRQRRPIVIEFCGSPKSGKTSSINSLNIFLKRNGFKTTILTERASVCPIPDKESPLFNVWTCSETINGINSEISKANLAEGVGPDIIICDRGVFDALCWFRWLKNRSKMDEAEYDILSKFALLDRWRRNIDLVYVFLADPDESIRREYANLLTDKRGSIMRENVLDGLRQSILDSENEYRQAFRALSIIDTTKREQNDVSYEVTEKTLGTLKDMLIEKIGFLPNSAIDLAPGVNSYSGIKDGLQSIQYGFREDVEQKKDCIQPIAVAVVLSKEGDKILCVKKTEKSTEADSPESGRTLLYVGGHMRKEDEPGEGGEFLETLKNTLYRELFEELGISAAVGEEEPFVIYTPDTEKSKKHLAVGWKIYLDEKTKLRLDSYELVQKKGKSRSGTFIPFEEITSRDITLESWSRTILLDILPDKITDAQKKILQENESYYQDSFDF